MNTLAVWNKREKKVKVDFLEFEKDLREAFREFLEESIHPLTVLRDISEIIGAHTGRGTPMDPRDY